MDKRVEAIGLGLLTTVVPLIIGYAVSGPVPTASPAVAMSRRQRRVARAPALARAPAGAEGDACLVGTMTSPVRNIVERWACSLSGGTIMPRSQALRIASERARIMR